MPHRASTFLALVGLSLTHAYGAARIPAVQTVDGIARTRDGVQISYDLRILRDGRLKLAIRNLGKRSFAYDASRVNLYTDDTQWFGGDLDGGIRGWLTRDNPFDPVYKKGKMVELLPGRRASISGRLNPDFKLFKGRKVKARLSVGLDDGLTTSQPALARSGLLSFKSPVTKGKESLSQKYGLRVEYGPLPDSPEGR